MYVLIFIALPVSKYSYLFTLPHNSRETIPEKKKNSLVLLITFLNKSKIKTILKKKESPNAEGKDQI